MNDDARIIVEITIDGDETSRCTFAEFIADNESGMETCEIDDIRNAITSGRTYTGGGGASPVWTIKAVRS